VSLANTMEESERPAKRIKYAEDDNGHHDHESHTTNSATPHNGDVTNERSAKGNGNSSSNLSRKRSSKNTNKAQSKVRTQDDSRSTRTFSRPSVICTGDKGIYVTCDKGREQKSLLELHDILQQYLEDAGMDASGKALNHQLASSTEDTGENQSSVNVEDIDIEADIASELAQMKHSDTAKVTTAPASRPMQLITLDIPCVSLLRFPPGSTLDPVDMVHKLCLSAARPVNPQQSRYIKRLTPISNLAKALSQGLEKICEEVLPRYFGAGEDGQVESKTFAIRPTIRNNDKLDRDEVIKLVATRVQELGEGQHKVDLKQYQKGVLVEVYRGWVSICVVENTSTGGYEKGFEELKRFNIAEIYSNR